MVREVTSGNGTTFRSRVLDYLPVLRRLRSSLRSRRLTASAKNEIRRDRIGLPDLDPGCQRVVEEGIAWLGRAQDSSLSADGGVAHSFSLIHGWTTSYPETTGYIIPTLLDFAASSRDEELRTRARRMLDWLVGIQRPDGSFQAGKIDAEPVVSCTFNTGQILIGLAAGAKIFGEPYLSSMKKAAGWLVATQDSDGAWRRYPTPFATPGEKAYETHVSWGLLEAERVTGGAGFGEAAIANVNWALTKQNPNGWFRDCSLEDPDIPTLTHTIGYVLRGVLEAFQFNHDSRFLKAAMLTADGVLGAMGPSDGMIPGRLDRSWCPASDWVCLTGSAQIASCWFMLFGITGDAKYREAGRLANEYVRRTIKVDGPGETKGAVKGSFPIQGEYGAFSFPNWACKFMIDANLHEMSIGGNSTP